MKRTLKSLTIEELRELITSLGKASSENAALIKMYLDKSQSGCLDDFKNRIDKALSKNKWSFREVRHTLSIFKRFAVKPEEIAELYVYAVESGNKITMMYGDIDENYYIAMENLYEDACKIVAALTNSTYADDLKRHLKDLVDLTKGIGWGYHDTLDELYYEYFGSSPDLAGN